MEDVHPQKVAGDAAFRAGQYEEAFARYSAALEEEEEHVPTLCNRSLAALKLGRAEDALEDAEAALQLLEEADEELPAGQLAKAVHRKAEALLALGETLEAIRTYRQGLAACRGSQELVAALRLAIEQLSVGWLAKYWAQRVEEAQAPNPLSSRDGRMIKPVPPELRLSEAELVAHMEAALYPLQDEARDLLCEAWAAGQRPGRAEAAFLRGAAYLSAGNSKQALKDVRFAQVYGPQLEDLFPAKEGALVPAGAAGVSPDALPPGAAAGRRSGWPAALALQSAALEALADNVLAALSMARAVELEPECEEYAASLERLMRRIPEELAKALQSGGVAELEAQLAGAKEAAKPEYLRDRPKYYYYYEWMKKRIYAEYPELPEPVMDKLLTIEANELDIILQYPRATHITVKRLMAVYEEERPEKLESYVVPMLSWEDYEAIKEESAAALPAGTSSGPGRMPESGRAGLETAGGLEGSQPGSKHASNGGPGGAAPALQAQGQARADEAVEAWVEGGDARADANGASEAGSLDIDELCGLD